MGIKTIITQTALTQWVHKLFITQTALMQWVPITITQTTHAMENDTTHGQRLKTQPYLFLPSVCFPQISKKKIKNQKISGG